MNHDQVPITGYVDRLSRRPGERVTAYVSLNGGDGLFTASLARVISADPNPDGPGMLFERLHSRFAQTLPGRFQPILIGSFGVLPLPHQAGGGAFTWTILFQTSVIPERGALLSGEGGEAALTVFLTKAGLVLEHGDANFSLPAKLKARSWYRLWLSVDPQAKTAILGLVDVGGSLARAEFHGSWPNSPMKSLMLAAQNLPDPRFHFTGKLEAPRVCAGFVDDWPEFDAVPATLISMGSWNLGEGIGTCDLIDPARPHLKGYLVNMPTRGVVGAFWSGREHCWRHAPDDYAAIHFHDDDLDDCRWEPSFEFTIPYDLPSGSYAFHLQSTVGEDWVPFYVLPPLGGPFQRIAFLAPTYTYTAYANSRWNNRSLASQERAASWGGAPYSPGRYPIYGCSTYDTHVDGSGVSMSSRRRPILSMRPGFISYFDSKGSGLRHYPADSHLLAWLEARGIGFDIITDEDLEEEGSAILAPYETVLTATHPEYHTSVTLDGLQAYLAQGGRLAYLGGNGFYWRVARSAERPHLLEVRRAESGIRTWAAEPGEYYHALDGQLGGLWLRNRRPPQALVGIGFAAQGPYQAGCYLRTSESYDPAVAWLFEGIEEARFGDYGLSAGGAAGFELDRAESALGTPDGAIVIARSTDLPAGFEPTHEEMLTEAITVSGVPVAEIVRSDMTYFRAPSGGEVLAVGSITFCGSLWRDGEWTGPVSRLLQNFISGSTTT